MPLAGPRPNPNPSNIPLSPPPNITERPAFPSTPTSSQLPYPHQSSPESGTTLLEPTNIDGTSQNAQVSPAEAVRREWEGSREPDNLEERDIVTTAPYHRSQRDTPQPVSRQYDDPYALAPVDEPDRLSAQSPSVGPWDSASQRTSQFNQFPIPQPTSIPLSSSETSSNRNNHLRNKPSYAGGLSYIDEEGAYHKSKYDRPASAMYDGGVEMQGLVRGAADMGEDDQPYRVKFAEEYENSPQPYPYSENGYQSMPNSERSKLYNTLLFPTGLDRLLALFGIDSGREPVQQAIERKKRGLGAQKWPVAAWGLAVAMTAVLVYELIANAHAQGTPIAIKPTFNYMIGPSSEVLINIGARFPPCMKLVQDLPPTFSLACLNDTANPPTTSCTLESICGHGGFPNGIPNQSWRFVVPIFLHVGVIHLAVNMIAQITAGAQVEREMGTIPFLLVYFAGGIYGFVLGGNFSRTGIPSVGASGALFATNACVLVDLLLHWKYEDRPKLKAFLLAIEFIIGIAIGYIPNAVDGLAHLGGFALGLLMGSILYPAISETKRHKYIVWGCRIVAIPLIILAFVLTIKNFYTADPNAACEWCRFLSCIPTSSNDRCTGTGISTTSTNVTKRGLGWEL